MKVLTPITYGTAIVLAVLSGGVSTYGLTKLGGDNLIAQVVIATMGLLFEAGKLVGFANLHVPMPRTLKCALCSVCLTLMSLNIVGMSGFLTSNYESQNISAHAVNRTAQVEATANVAALERQLAAAEARIDKATEALGKARGDRDQIKAVNAMIATASKERDAIAKQLTLAQAQGAHAEGATIAAAGEFAMVTFIAEALHVNQERVAHTVFLGIACIPDVLAVLLLLAAGHASRVQVVAEQPVVEEEVPSTADVEPESEPTEPEVVQEVPTEVAKVPQLTARQIAGRKGSMAAQVNKMVRQRLKEVSIQRGQMTKKRNKRAKAKVAKAQAAWSKARTQ